MKFRRYFLLIFFVIVFQVVSFAANNGLKSDTTTNLSRRQPQSDPIVSIIDSLISLNNFEIFKSAKETGGAAALMNDSVPLFDDLVLEARLAELNKKSPIELDFSEAVRSYINLFTIKRRDQVTKMLGLSELYFPIFEEALDRYNLPMELKYLPIVESALNPLAKSPSGAVGLWQFLLNCSKMFDLEVDSYIDERCDPYKATEAACKYLEYLHRIFNDWQLALAAYNGGPGVVRNAIQRSGGKTNFWEIRPYLPKETQGYVPAFIAANYVINYAKEHNLYAVAPRVYYYDTDTVKIKHAVFFAQISSVINVSPDLLRFLNPSYKRNFVPYGDEPVNLILPANKVADYLQHESEIYGLELAKANYNTLVSTAGQTANKMKIIHTVRKGEYFHKIAMDYKCTIENIIAWNNLASKSLGAGQKLIIWVNPSFDSLATDDVIAEPEGSL